MGLTLAEWIALSGAEKEAMRQTATARLNEGRPDFCVDTVAEMPAVLDEIEFRLAAGERPRE